MKWHVYIIFCSDDTLYTGITTDMERRLRQHQAGKGAKYFRGRRPLRVVYLEKNHSRSSAAAREAQIKSLSRAEKVDLFFPAASGNKANRGIAMKDIKQHFQTEDLFARHAGIELLDVAPGWSKVCMKIQPYHFNGAGTVHGGAIFTLADFAFAAASNSHGTLAMGINASVNFVKAATKGTLYAEAREQSLNPKLASYSVTVTGQDNEIIALFQGMVYRKKQSLVPAGND